AGIWVSYGAYTHPTELDETRTVEDWSTAGDLSHSATVTEENAVFEKGTVLRDEPLYYTAISPTANGEYTVAYEAASGDVDVDLRIDQPVRATDDDTVYWAESDRVAAANQTAVGPGEAVATSFEVDVEAASARIDEIEADLGASPGQIEHVLEATVEVAGDVNGEHRDVGETHEITVSFDGSAFEFEDTRFDEGYTTTETETVSVSPSPVQSIGGPLLAVLALGGLGAVGLASYRWNPPSDTELDWLDYQTQREEYEDLLTVARLPDSIYAKDRAPVDSLETLAVLAIDIESALVFDPTRSVYLVDAGDLVYGFEPPASPVCEPTRQPPSARQPPSPSGPPTPTGPSSRIETGGGVTTASDARIQRGGSSEGLVFEQADAAVVDSVADGGPEGPSSDGGTDTEPEGGERCLALTADGDRCSRPAVEDGLCFQHDERDRSVRQGKPPITASVDDEGTDDEGTDDEGTDDEGTDDED
ncbi:MAG: gas vesicle protein GvpO, halophile-type, partial [Halobacteriota archaeon]